MSTLGGRIEILRSTNSANDIRLPAPATQARAGWSCRTARHAPARHVLDHVNGGNSAATIIASDRRLQRDIRCNLLIFMNTKQNVSQGNGPSAEPPARRAPYGRDPMRTIRMRPGSRSPVQSSDRQVDARPRCRAPLSNVLAIHNPHTTSRIKVRAKSTPIRDTTQGWLFQTVRSFGSGLRVDEPAHTWLPGARTDRGARRLNATTAGQAHRHQSQPVNPTDMHATRSTRGAG